MLTIKPRKKMKALNVIDSIEVSPGLLEKIYLKKLININNWIKNIVKNIGNCPLVLLLIIRIRAIANDRKIIPIISLKPAIAWLNDPKLLYENSSVKIRSWIE